MAYRYTDVNTRAVYSTTKGTTGQAGKLAKFWKNADGTGPVDIGLYDEDTPETPGTSTGSNVLTVGTDGMWPAMWDREGAKDHVFIQVGTLASPGEIYRLFCDADQRLDALATAVAGAETNLASIPGAYTSVVNHGKTASTVRPPGAVRVIWQGSAVPSNGIEGDEWSNPLTGVRCVRLSGAWAPYGSSFLPIKVQQAVQESGAATTRTATLASTPTEGNILVAFCLIRSGNTAGQVTGPAGYTLVSLTATSANSARVGVWVKDVGSGESPSATVTVAVSTGVYLTLMEWAGVTSSVDVVNAGNTSASNATSRVLGPATTTTQDNDLVLAYLGGSSTLGTIGPWTKGFTEDGSSTSHTIASKVVSTPTEPTTSISWATPRVVTGVLVGFKAKRAVNRAPALTRPVRSLFDPVADFGAAGDGTTDDTAAVVAAAAAAKAVGGKLYLSKICRTSAPLAISGTMSIGGASRACGIVNGASDIFAWSGYGIAVSNLLLRSENGGGHIFDQVGDTVHCTFLDVDCDQQNADKSIYRHVNDLGNYLFNSWSKSKLRHVRTGTVPTMHFKPITGGGAVNANLFERLEILNPSAVYGFHLESARDGNYLYGVTLRDISWEVPAGGCVKALGCNGIVIENNEIYDLNAQQAVAHLFYIGQGTHSTNPVPTRNFAMKGLYHVGPLSELAAGVQHIYLESGKVPNAYLENVRHNVTNNMLIDYGNNFALELGCPAVARTNAGSVTRVSSAGFVIPSPDGTAYKINVANGGAVSTTAV